MNGRKTQIRRLWPKGRSVRPGSIHQCQTRLFDQDSVFARVRIVDVFQHRLGEITPEDAWAEGYDSAIGYLRAFARINGYAQVGKVLRLDVWAVIFEVVG